VGRRITLPHPVTKEDMTFTMEDPEWLDFVVKKREEALWIEKHGERQPNPRFMTMALVMKHFVNTAAETSLFPVYLSITVL
jgi:hypothetical protein